MEILEPLKRNSRKGFTLIELMITAGIIGIIIALAIPGIKTLRETSQDERFINDLRLIRNSFEIYILESGNRPADRSRGEMPPEMVSILPRNFSFSENSSIGGIWNWESSVFGIAAGISIVDPNREGDEMTEIDAAIDDGNPNTGLFIETQNNRYTWVIEE